MVPVVEAALVYSVPLLAVAVEVGLLVQPAQRLHNQRYKFVELVETVLYCGVR